VPCLLCGFYLSWASILPRIGCGDICNSYRVQNDSIFCT
jgi:hypothetical protein